ncbi:hypothetical protein LPJ61_005915 [Coemansia biformis]|uniref:Uncharacterized protein n=1 Tax=Coemansia biformis TaxID=1286918 RepID=A0A9W8CQL5_9FUNG|nr:hypothetical protein LPJ61_005915 [Coemansia biformis]
MFKVAAGEPIIRENMGAIIAGVATILDGWNLVVDATTEAYGTWLFSAVYVVGADTSASPTITMYEGNIPFMTKNGNAAFVRLVVSATERSCIVEGNRQGKPRETMFQFAV